MDLAQILKERSCKWMWAQMFAELPPSNLSDFSLLSVFSTFLVSFQVVEKIYVIRRNEQSRVDSFREY